MAPKMLYIYVICITRFDYTLTEIVTLRIDEETKLKVKRLGISVSKVARSAILREIEAKEREEALDALRKMRQILRKVDMRTVVEDIRQDRAAR
jgi:post-segregation antitoxin (ccd killing protein)